MTHNKWLQSGIAHREASHHRQVKEEHFSVLQRGFRHDITLFDRMLMLPWMSRSWPNDIGMCTSGREGGLFTVKYFKHTTFTIDKKRTAWVLLFNDKKGPMTNYWVVKFYGKLHTHYKTRLKLKWVMNGRFPAPCNNIKINGSIHHMSFMIWVKEPLPS